MSLERSNTDAGSPLNLVALLPESLRPLGAFESMLFKRLSVGTTAVVDIKEDLSEEKLIEALSKTIARHPLLHVNIAPDISDTKCLHFVDAGLESKDLARSRLTVQRLDSAEEARCLLTKHVNQDALFQYYACNWSFLVVQVGETGTWRFTFLFNHAIGDGFSGYRVLHDVLSFYGGGTEVEPLPINPPIAELVYPHGAPCLLRCVGYCFARCLKDLLSTLSSELQHLLPQLAVKTNLRGPRCSQLLETDVVEWTGNTDNFAKLKIACKAQTCTVGGVGMAAIAFLMFAVEKCNAERRSTIAPTQITFGYDINMRSRLSPSLGVDHVGLYIMVMKWSAGKMSDETSFWELARAATHEMKRQINKKEPHEAHYMMQRIYDAGDDLLDGPTPIPGLWPDSFNCSNIGAWPWGQDYAIGKVAEIYTTQGYPKGGNIIGFIIWFCGVGGRMSYSANYSKVHHGDKNASYLLRHIASFCEGEMFDFEKSLSFGDYYYANKTAIEDSYSLEGFSFLVDRSACQAN